MVDRVRTGAGPDRWPVHPAQPLPRAALDVGAPSVIGEDTGRGDSLLHQVLGQASLTDGPDGRSGQAFELELSFIVRGMADLLARDRFAGKWTAAGWSAR